LIEQIQKIEIPDIPLGHLYNEKKQEILHKLLFVQAFMKQNIKDMNKYLELLYGKINQEYVEVAQEIIQAKEDVSDEEEKLTLDEIRDYVKKFNHIYDLQLQLVEKES